MNKYRLLIPVMAICLILAVVVPLKGEAAEKPIELKFAAAIPKTMDMGMAAQWWIDEVQKRTNGRIKVTAYWDSALFTIQEMLEAVKSGAVDCGHVVPAYSEKAWPLLQGWNDSHAWASKREELWGAPKVFERVPALQKEVTDNNLVMMNWGSLQEYGIISIKPIKSMAETKGLRVRTWGSQYPRRWKPWGAVSVSILAPDCYEAMSKGMLDVVPATPSHVTSYKWYEAAKYWLEGPFLGAIGGQVMMNLNRYNSLPKDIQKILMEIRADSALANLKIRDRVWDQGTAKMKAEGVTFMGRVSKEDEEKMLKIADDVLEAYLTTDMDKIGKGKEGRQVLEELRRMRQEYNNWIKTPEGQEWLEPKY